LRIRKTVIQSIPSDWFLTVLLVLVSWSVVILLSGENPFTVFTYIFQGFVGSSEVFCSTLNKLFIFILTALAFAIPAWTGMWNVGGEGQLLLGGFFAAWLATLFNTGFSLLNILITLLFSALIGGIWALWPALLRAQWNINEVVVTLMSNYLVVFFTDYMVNFPLRAEGSSWPRMEYIPRNFEINNIGGTDLSYTFIISITILIISSLIRRYCIVGFEYRMTGSNEVFAKQGGIPVSKARIQAMFVGGIMAGLAGGMLVLGLNSTFMSGFSPGYAFTGLLVALVSKNIPITIMGVAFCFSALQIGAINMQLFSRIPAEITGVLQSIMVFFIAAQESLHFKIKTGDVSKSE